MKILGIILVICLQGCGLQWGSQHPSLVQKYPAIQIPFAHDTFMHQLVLQTLQHEGVDTDSLTAPTLKIVSNTLEQHPLVYALDGELRREQMRLTVAFELHTPAGTHPLTLTSVRERAIISRQRLAADIELQNITRSMQRDIMHQLVRHLRLA